MAEWKVSEVFEPGKMNINQWAEEDRPREKMLSKGADSLSKAELLAILIGSGSQKENAVELMQRILRDCGGSLKRLARMSVEELKTYDGIGEAKAITILAACHLARRREEEEKDTSPKLNDAMKIFNHMHHRIKDLDVEEAFVILMNHNFTELKTVRLSHGGFTETAVDVRVIVKEALMVNATMVALIHNHPSGNLKPSRDDDKITESVKQACKMMRLHLMDHIIVTDGGYYSYHEQGRL